MWEHKDGRIIPASCSGIEPVRNLQVTEVANYPSRRRWLHGLVVTDYKSYDATNQTERSPVTEIREHLKIPDRKIHDAVNHPERFPVADEVQSSESSSWRELHEDSDPECLIVSDNPECLTESPANVRVWLSGATRSIETDSSSTPPDYFPTHCWEDIFASSDSCHPECLTETSSDDANEKDTVGYMKRAHVGRTRVDQMVDQKQDNIGDAYSDDMGHTEPICRRFFRVSPLPHRCVSPLPHHRAASPFHARADDDDDANDDSDYSVCPDAETECHSHSKHFQTSTTRMFFGSRRW